MNTLLLIITLASSAPSVVRVDAPHVRVSSRVRLVSTLGLVGGTALSIGNTVGYWGTMLSSSSDGLVVLGAALGTWVASVPILGPALAIVMDLMLGPNGPQDVLDTRIALNAVAGSVQVLSLVFLLLAPRFDGTVTAPMKGLSVSPVAKGDGLMVGWRGTF